MHICSWKVFVTSIVMETMASWNWRKNFERSKFSMAESSNLRTTQNYSIFKLTKTVNTNWNNIYNERQIWGRRKLRMVRNIESNRTIPLLYNSWIRFPRVANIKKVHNFEFVEAKEQKGEFWMYSRYLNQWEVRSSCE